MKTQFIQSFTVKLLAVGLTLAFGSMLVPRAEAVFEAGYTFESPSVQASVKDFNLTYDAYTSGYLNNVGDGPTLTSGAAKHGSVGLDFNNVTGISINAGAAHLQTFTNNLTFANALTWAMWINMSSFSTDSDTLVSTQPGADTRFQVIGTDGAGAGLQGGFRFYNPSAGDHYSSAGLVSIGVWTHIALTWDDVSDTVLIYTNGAVAATFSGITSIGAVNTGVPLQFGQNWGSGGSYETAQFRGYMDDIYFSDFAKSQTEIQALMDVIPEPSTVALLGLGGLLFLRRLRKS